MASVCGAFFNMLFTSSFVEAAISFLKELLSDGKKLSAVDCEAKLEAAGFKKSTAKKAKRKAGIVSHKEGFMWYWTLPAVVKPNDERQEVTDDDDLPY